MRHTHALAGILLIAFSCAEVSAADSGSHWWQFKKKSAFDTPQAAAADTANSTPWNPDRSAAANPGITATTAQVTQPALPNLASEEPSDSHWMLNSPFGKKVSWPRLSVWEKESPAEAERNAWAGKTIEPVKPGPMHTMSEHARHAGQTTKAAWHKTVDKLTPWDNNTDDKTARTARNEVRPPFWKRMMGSDKPEVQSSETVPEFMAQQRLSP